MTPEDAIGNILAAACSWAENAQEGMARQVNAETTDEQCATIAADSGEFLETVLELRNYDRAVKNPMGEAELDCLLVMATSWAENTEEGFPSRIKADMTDEECRQIADMDEVGDADEVMFVRDLWQSIDLMLKHQMKA